MFLPSVNLFAVTLATVAALAIGFAWYSDYAFGKEWMRLLGITRESLEKAKKDMGPKYLLMLVSALVMSYVLALLVKFLGAQTIVGGAKTGFLAWLGFVATIGLNPIIFENKSFNLYVINAGYYLVSLVVMGIILATMA